MQDKLLTLLEETAQRAHAPVPAVQTGVGMNTGHVYFQDNDWSTVLDLGFSFQSEYAVFRFRWRSSDARVEVSQQRVRYHDGESIRKLMSTVREVLEARRPL